MQWPVYYLWSLFIIRNPLLHHLCRIWLAINIQRNLPGTKHGPRPNISAVTTAPSEWSFRSWNIRLGSRSSCLLSWICKNVYILPNILQQILKTCCESVENRKPSYEASIRKSANFQVCGSSSPSFYRVTVHCEHPAVHFCVRFSTGTDNSLVIVPLTLEARHSFVPLIGYCRLLQ